MAMRDIASPTLLVAYISSREIDNSPECAILDGDGRNRRVRRAGWASRVVGRRTGHLILHTVWKINSIHDTQ
jgi:hypothetical protein